MRYEWKEIFKESAPLLSLMAFIGIMGGQILHNIEDTLLIFPIFLVILPMMNGLGGNLGAILGARISSGLHSGYINPDIFDVEMGDNMHLTLIAGSITYITVAVVVASSTMVINLHVLATNLIIIIIGAGMIITVSTLLLTVLVSLWSYKKRIDPDNVVIPVITTLADFISILALYLMVWVVIL